MAVRRAETKNDIDRVIELGAVMHAESAYKEYPCDIEHLKKYSRSFEEQPEEFAAFMNEEDGDITAVVAGYLAPLYFDPKTKFAYDFLLYSKPEKRGGPAAVRLMKAFEKWSRDSGASAVVMGVTAGIADETACKFYTRLGYKNSGALFSKEID